ncbi:hypothetical protein [uncultured Microscilla sp.]|uniref:hypothetical protein n=1 Tax=uncultured Microscilla sp. TaxID=432653 RepID=UPI002631ED9D|nr:hypothetical protein [uncultured Microscilla sp.]
MAANTNQYTKQKSEKKTREAQFATQIIYEVSINTRLQKKVQQIQKKFSPKPTLQDKKSLYNLAVAFEWVFGLLGVALGLYLMYAIFLDAFTNPIAAFTGALLFLGAWEYGKHVLLASILREKYVYRRTNTWFLLLNILMISCSMWWSVQGILNFNQEVIVEKPQTISLAQIKKRHQNEIAKLNRTTQQKHQAAKQEFNTKIRNIEQATNKYLGSVKYKGSINVHNHANRTVITNSSNRIANLEKAQRTTLEKIQEQKTEQLAAILATQKAELTETQQKNKETIGKAAIKNENRYWNLLWLAFIGDIACAIAVWYRVFHFYRGLQEIQQAEKLTGVKVISNTLTPKPSISNHSKSPVPLTKKENKIYKLYMQSNQSLTKTQMNKSTGISRTIIDNMFKKTGIKYHRAQPKKVSNFPKEKSVQVAV